MSQQDKVSSQLDVIDRAFECLEAALEGTGFLFPTTEATVIGSRSHFHLTLEQLPESLRDPFKVLARGRHVEQRGLSMSNDSTESKLEMEGEFAIAARNGGKLDNDLLTRMRNDRSIVEKRRKLE